MEIPDSLVDELVKNPIFKTDTRAIFFLLQNPEPASFDMIAGATGVSRKCVNRSIKRLTEAGLLQPGEIQPRMQRFNVTGWEHLSPPPVTKEDKNVQSDNLESRFNRLESIILNMVDNSGSVNGQTGTGIVLRSAIDEPVCPLQDKMNPVNIPNVPEPVSVGIKAGQTESTTDPVVSIIEPSITRAQELEKQAALASLLKEKQANSKSIITCAREEFRSAFGVSVPENFQDLDAVSEMVRRKNAGKLNDIKSPLGYLNSISGKVQPPVDVNHVIPAVSPFLPVNTEPPRLSHADMERINSIWDAMTVEQKMPYKDKALPKFEQQAGRYKVPLNLLAKSVFNNEQMMNQGVTI